MSHTKRRQLTDKEKAEIDAAISRKTKNFKSPKATSCDYHAGVCTVACNADPVGTAGCPPCPPASEAEGVCAIAT